MPILDCNVKNCVHNMESRCQLEHIQVEGKNATEPNSTVCGSFQLKRSDASYSNSSYIPDPENDVTCEAEKCCFNDHRKCQADHIGISGCDACTCGETECKSFQCKC